MKEKRLRQLHRSVGIPLALFYVLQSASGIVLSIEELLGTYWGGIIHDIHYRFGQIGNFYRVVLGISLLWMALSGCMIYMNMRARTKAA